jgi:hypothetical protein
MENTCRYTRLFLLSLLDEAPHCLPFLPESTKMGPGVKSNDLTLGVLVLGCFARQKRKAPNILELRQSGGEADGQGIWSSTIQIRTTKGENKT